MTNTHYEKRLTGDEVSERTKQLVGLFSSQESIAAEIDDHHRELRAARKQLREVDARVRVVSREIQSGVALLPRQQEIKEAMATPMPPEPSMLAIIDPLHPDPEHEKPELRDRFAELYPMAADVPTLRLALYDLVTSEQRDKIDAWAIPHPATGIFNETAHWARVEKARHDGAIRAQGGLPTLDGLTIPRALPMPQVLATVLGVKVKKKGARPLTSPKRKAKARKAKR